jgi:3',5'-cyclic AMP phosphodiesterase CpdA
MNLDLSRRTFLKQGAFATAGLAAATHIAAAAETSPRTTFRFVHLTDIHVQPELGAERGFRKCIAHVNELRPRPDFVVTGGDLVMDCLKVDKSRIASLWRMYDDCCRDFDMPVYNTIGNHDIVGWADDSPVAPSDFDYGKKLFADRAGQGRTYSSFDFGRWHFVLLDSIGQKPGSRDYFPMIDDEQIAWLKDDLSTVGAGKPIVFVTHVPFYTAYMQMALGPNSLPGEKSMVSNAYTLRKDLLKHDLRLVLQGHVHVRERIDYGKISYIQSGAVSGQWWKGPTLGEHPEGYSVIDVAGDTFTHHFADYGWQAVKA